jgi:hypothetical protein
VLMDKMKSLKFEVEKFSCKNNFELWNPQDERQDERFICETRVAKNIERKVNEINDHDGMGMRRSGCEIS